jgi:hypothetical protein
MNLKRAIERGKNPRMDAAHAKRNERRLGM